MIIPLQLETGSATQYCTLNAQIKYWNNINRLINLLLESKDLFIQWVLSILSHTVLFVWLSKTALDSQTLRLAPGKPLNSCT